MAADSAPSLIPQTGPKPFAFVLMPFSDEFNDVFELGIKQACAAAEVFCERVDQQIFFGNILERIYNQIGKADVVIADMTGRNANVFYEVGYAHALNKRVILITRNADDIPFDLKHYPHIVYSGQIASQLRPKLEAAVRWCVEHPQESMLQAAFPLELYLAQDRVRDFPGQVGTTDVIPSKRSVLIKVSFHNPTRTVYRGPAAVWLIAPDVFDSNSLQTKTVFVPKDRIMHYLGEVEKVPPEAWEGFELNLIARTALQQVDPVIELTVRVFTDLGPRDESFKLRVRNE